MAGGRRENQLWLATVVSRGNKVKDVSELNSYSPIFTLEYTGI